MSNQTHELRLNQQQRISTQSAKAHNRWHPAIPPALHIDDGDGSAFLGEQLRGLLADVTARAGDDRDLVGQFHIRLCYHNGKKKLWTQVQRPNQRGGLAAFVRHDGSGLFWRREGQLSAVIAQALQ